MDASIEAQAIPTTSQQVDGSKQQMSDLERLEALSAKATALYGMKDYSAAADVYSEATELQAQVNGELNTENADLLFAYGRCLFRVAQKASTVLGGTVAQAQLAQDKEKKVSKKRKANQAQNSSAQAATPTLPETIETKSAADVVPESDIRLGQDASEPDNAPLFQITGDENWTDSEDDDEQEDDAEEEEEDDDFANSFELLDLARVLYLRKLESLQESTANDADKGKYIASIDLTPPVRELKSRIADIYDLQAEIDREGEKFDNAVTNLKACLALREELESPESSILAACHLDLSIALEAAAQDQERDKDGNPIGDIKTNWEVRNEAITQQEKAIDCSKLRVSKETKLLEGMEAGKKKDDTMVQIEDVQGMIGEMEDRLAELRKPPVNVKAETENDSNKDMMAGIMGQIKTAINVSEEEKKEQIAKVIAGATDLSGMVKRKKPKSEAAIANGSGTKRKVAFADSSESSSNVKKAKVEDVEDSGL